MIVGGSEGEAKEMAKRLLIEIGGSGYLIGNKIFQLRLRLKLKFAMRLKEHHDSKNSARIRLPIYD